MAQVHDSFVSDGQAAHSTCVSVPVELRNQAYDKFDGLGDCRLCQWHITYHRLSSGEAFCPAENGTQR